MKRLTFLVPLLLGSAPVAAQPEARQTITVAVGASSEVEVGFAMGHQCDDESIAAGEMRNKSEETNVFVVTGKKAGTTLCRAGTYLVEDRPSFLFEIVVTAVPKPATSAKRRKPR